MKRPDAIRYGICASLALIVGACVACGRGLLSSADGKGVLLALSDGFFVPGALLFCAGGLTWIASKGQFDAFGYVFSRFSFHSLIPGSVRSMEPKPENLYEYKAKRDAKGRKWLKHAWVTGLVSFGISVVLTMLYSFL